MAFLEKRGFSSGSERFCATWEIYYIYARDYFKQKNMRKIFLVALLGIPVLQCAEGSKASHGTVSLSVTEQYGMTNGAGDHVLFGEKIEAILKAAGFRVVTGQSAAIELRADLQAEPVLERYDGGIEAYTGANLSVSLEMSRGEETAKESFVGSRPSIEIVGTDTTYRNPSNAPFAEALEASGVFEGLAVMIGQAFGPEPLVAAAGTKTVWIERGYRRLPFRIENYACAALRRITGKEYGDDAEIWDLWWKRSRDIAPQQ